MSWKLFRLLSGSLDAALYAALFPGHESDTGICSQMQRPTHNRTGGFETERGNAPKDPKTPQVPKMPKCMAWERQAGEPGGVDLRRNRNDPMRHARAVFGKKTAHCVCIVGHLNASSQLI